MHLRTAGPAAVLFTLGTIVGPAVAPYIQAQEPSVPSIVTIPNRRYNQGTDTFGPIAVPVGLTAVNVSVTRVSWPVVTGDIIQIMTQVSFDGGNTWRDWAGFGAPGGDILKRDGSIATTSTLNATLPDDTNTLRQVRGTITVNRALDSAITITLE